MKGLNVLQSVIQRVLIVFLFNVLMLGVSGTSSAKPNHKSIASPSAWRSNVAYSKQLASPVSVGEYYVRPPLGFTFEKKQLTGDAKTGEQYDWHGPAGPDGTRPRFVIAIFKLRPGAINQYDVETWLSSNLEAMNKNEKHYVHTGIEQGKVNGISFARAYWKRDPNDPDDGKRFHGFQYEYQQGAISLTIIGDDVEPHYKSTLDLLEAAALTFHQ